MAVGIGIIGAGGISRFHARNFLSVPEARLVAISDVVPKAAAAVAAAYGIPIVADSADALLARDDVDGVVICTPNDSHASLAIAAAGAGKHVLCEKPLALTVAEAREMLAAAQTAGVHHMVNFSKRPFPAIVQLKDMIDAGELGDLLHVESTYLQSWLVAPSLGGDPKRLIWRLDGRVSGSGVLGDLGSHIIDLTQHVLGPITHVAGLLETKAPPVHAVDGTLPASSMVDDHMTAMVQFASGASGVLVSSRVAAGARDELQLRLTGTRGAVRFDNGRPDHLQVCLGEANMKYSLWSEMTCPLPPTVPASLNAAFARGIVSGTPASPTFEDGLRVQQVMEAIEQAAASRAWVAVS